MLFPGTGAANILEVSLFHFSFLAIRNFSSDSIASVFQLIASEALALFRKFPFSQMPVFLAVASTHL